MARTKQTARRPKPVRDILDINDPFPSRLIEAVRSLPTSDGAATASESSGEPLSKRRKVTVIPSSAFYIAKGSVGFSRSCLDGKSESYVEKRFNAGAHLSCWVRDGRLMIKSRSQPGSPASNQVALIMTLAPHEVTKDVEHIMRISSDNSPNGSPGAVWFNIDVTLERKDTVVITSIEFHLYWNETPSPLNGLRQRDYRKPTQDLIDTFFPTSRRLASAWSPMDFYEAAFVPPKDDSTSSTIEIPGMDATLYPYQKRTLQWLLKREGVQWTNENGIRPLLERWPAPASESSRVVRDLKGESIFLNDIFHTVTRNNESFCRVERTARGGILAEEMGLGKTLEILGLILLHPWPCRDQEEEAQTESRPIRSGTTLIVTPESLRQQWLSEISRHAPGLRCEFYQGCKREGGEGDTTAKRLAECDLVITTYAILSAEIHFAKDAPERSRRQERKYERPKSPLVQVEWWRLCLDEAQMIENGFSQAAIVARTIPRVNAWGITGTPVKDDVKDLFGLLSFLRYEPLCSAPQVWQALISGHKPVFQKLFNAISLRHTKALVRDEIALPPQRRFVISVPFTAVEEQHYQSLYKEMMEECGLDAQGNPVVEEWDPEEYEESMRTWLNRLRQTALHPEVGVYSRRILGQNKSRPMRTVEEVLDAMIEQSDNSIKADHRALLSNKLTRGQLFENSPRVKEALAIWEDVRKETTKMVTDARAELQAAKKDESGIEPAGNRETEEPENSQSSDDESDEVQSRGRVGEGRRKLRFALEMQHKAVFFCANAYFQIRDDEEMTKPDSDEFHKFKKLEDESYEEAKTIRREILRESHRKATRLMMKLSRKASDQTFTEISELLVKSDKGIESGRIIDNLELLYGELNQQANVIDEWREHVVQLLLKSLLDEEDDVETTGEEMGDAVKIQDELIVYVQALRSAIADRQDAMTGQTNELVKYEAQTSIRMAKDGDGPAPEKLLELMQQRAEIKPQIAHTSMRGTISELRSLVTRLRNEPHQTERVRVEHAIASRHLQDVQAALSEQTKAATSLESEIETFTTAMNLRLEYYRQLQSVSDSVMPYDGPKTEDAAARLAKTEEDLKRKLAIGESKHRYLLHLKEAGSKSSEPRMCVICQMPFETGVLTICGHQFCKECMMMWYKAHRNCPVCKKHLTPAQLHDITMKPQELKLHGDSASQSGQEGEDSAQQSQDGTPKKTMIYSAFNTEKLAEIKNIELDGPSYTTKVDTLVRHLLWLRESDPGAKSIVFSQYRDFLGVLGTAFRRFRIGYASIDTHGGTTRFKEDPAVEVFLLHARAHASGLNLVNANHVFLCEPLVNTALELQAIARVDRIGQQHETTVWLYITSGTVEESIYNLSVKRRMEHMGDKGKKGKSKESTPELLDASLEEANTLEMEHAALSKLMSKDKTAGEVVDKGDLWECLFGHVANGGEQSGQRTVIDVTEN